MQFNMAYRSGSSMTDEEWKSWKDGFEKSGFTLNPGLTPKQNAAEIRRAFDKVHERWTKSVEAYKESNVELRKERDAALLQLSEERERCIKIVLEFDDWKFTPYNSCASMDRGTTEVDVRKSLEVLADEIRDSGEKRVEVVRPSNS